MALTLPHVLSTPGLTQALTQAQVVIEAVATLAFAASGLIVGARKGLDPFGVACVAGLAAFGGGTLRDVLLDRRPFVWVAHPSWLWVLVGLTIIAVTFLRASHLRLTERAILLPDALGLGLFTANGTQIALGMGMPAVVAVLMGMMTAVCGGMLRDIVCNEIPAVLRDHRPYALCALGGGWIVVVAAHVGADPWIGLAGTAAVTTLLRLAALSRDWALPRWRVEASRHDAADGNDEPG